MLNQLIYGDIRGSQSGSGGYDAPGFSGDINPSTDYVVSELLRARSGKLIYSDGFRISLYTWWDFYQTDDENDENDVSAYINGVNRCGGHTTGHIIDYEVSNPDFSGRGSTVTLYVNMRMGDNGREDSTWNGGASCRHRLWGGTGGTNGWYIATANHKKEKGGTCGGGATFKVIYDVDKDDYRIT